MTDGVETVIVLELPVVVVGVGVSTKAELTIPVAVTAPVPLTEKPVDLNGEPVKVARDRSMPLAIVGAPLIARIEPVVLSGEALVPSPIWKSVPQPTAPDWLTRRSAASLRDPATASFASWTTLRPHLSRTVEPVRHAVLISRPQHSAMFVAAPVSWARSLPPNMAPFSVPTPPPSPELAIAVETLAT